jgi:ABC-type lipoprotein release transport system permease subunit
MPLPLRYSVGSLLERRVRTGLTVGVIALAVLATTLFGGLVSSMKRTLASTGDPRNLIVMRKGATNDGSSAVTLEAFQAIRFFEGVARDASGQPLASPELVVQPFFTTKSGDARENVLVRGVEAIALAVHREVAITEGRMINASSGEALVGRGVAGRYAGAELGQQLDFGRKTWKVVGIFESGGSSLESEVWVDARELAIDAKRPVPYSGIRVRVSDGADMDALARRIGDDPRYALEATRETAYYAKQAESANTFLLIVIGLALLAGIGAAFGAVNTLYASVQARRAEIGTLRAIGFSRGAVLFAFLVESLALALAGFAIGALAAVIAGKIVSLLLGGVGFGVNTFSTSVIEISVGLRDCALALALSLAIGIIGGFFPAARAAQLRPVEALRKA